MARISIKLILVSLLFVGSAVAQRRLDKYEVGETAEAHCMKWAFAINNLGSERENALTAEDGLHAASTLEECGFKMKDMEKDMALTLSLALYKDAVSRMQRFIQQRGLTEAFNREQETQNESWRKKITEGLPPELRKQVE